MHLRNRSAVVTGGNSGIGLAVARELHREGARVVVFGRDPDTLERARIGLGAGAVAMCGDVTRAEDLRELFRLASDVHGGVDILVACAGVYEPIPFPETDPDAFDRTCDVNFKGVFFTVQAALPHLREGASVILVTSTAHEAGVPGLSVYSATKAAVRSLARTLASELLPRGIRVNALSPGVIDTPIFSRAGLSEEEVGERLAAMREMIPMGRIGKPEEIGRAAVFLASDASSYVAGSELVVSGGLGEV